MSEQAVLNGISAYRYEMEVLTRLMRRKEDFTDRDFDRLFVGREIRKRRKLFPQGGIAGNSFILGMGQNGGTMWAFYLDLLQHMVSAGLVKTSTSDYRIIYTLTEKK